MGEVHNFGVIKGDKPEACGYCGQPEHVVPLACPRIKAVTLYADGETVEIEFREDWPPGDVA